MLILTAIVLSVHVTSCIGGIGTAWENFWSATCEFSTIVSRSRRSVPEPDIRNPEELFDYLYPLADTKVEDLLSNSGRASDVHPHSLSNWLDDVVDLWQSECHKRSLSKGAEEGRSSSWNMFRRNASSTESGSAQQHKGEVDDSESGGDDESDSEDSGEGKKDKASEAPAVKDDDTFFAAYGGDIEYFFPLLSFGIPFDGEISLLGFHGFKGLFPYK